MRLFQNAGLYPSYIPRLRKLTRGLSAFTALRSAFLADRYGASHHLAPILEGSADAFFTNGDDPELQGAWATENGLKADTPLPDVLLAQIEAHGAEVFYNSDPVRYGAAFLKRLPGCVRRSIAWRAAPTPGSVDLRGYIMVCNFAGILEGYRGEGLSAELLYPAHDPALDAFAMDGERPIDVLFVGGYSRHHRRRAAVLEMAAALPATVVLHLDQSRLTRLAELPGASLIPKLARLARPASIRRASVAPVFGRDLYAALGSAKIVLNGAVDMAGDERGNMRCWEAMGASALMVSDAGRYPPGMADGITMLAYRSPEEARSLILDALADEPRRRALADAGRTMLAERYSKAAQWRRFQEIAG